MSEIGPTRVRLQRPWRISSCPAANGIICSRCAPISTIAPEGTCSAMACCMRTSLDDAAIVVNSAPPAFSFLPASTAAPSGRALFQKRVNAFLRVLSFHQLVEIEAFDRFELRLKLRVAVAPQGAAAEPQHNRTQSVELCQQRIHRLCQRII